FTTHCQNSLAQEGCCFPPYTDSRVLPCVKKSKRDYSPLACINKWKPVGTHLFISITMVAAVQRTC
ncbi:MAG TPA: hypothetical protein VGE06_09195, partial [Flavisolibacter sp.]